MLMADAGDRLREIVESERSLDRWKPCCTSTPSCSWPGAGDVDDLLAIGCPT